MFATVLSVLAAVATANTDCLKSADSETSRNGQCFGQVIKDGGVVNCAGDYTCHSTVVTSSSIDCTGTGACIQANVKTSAVSCDGTRSCYGAEVETSSLTCKGEGSCTNTHGSTNFLRCLGKNACSNVSLKTGSISCVEGACDGLTVEPSAAGLVYTCSDESGCGHVTLIGGQSGSLEVHELKFTGAVGSTITRHIAFTPKATTPAPATVDKTETKASNPFARFVDARKKNFGALAWKIVVPVAVASVFFIVLCAYGIRTLCRKNGTEPVLDYYSPLEEKNVKDQIFEQYLLSLNRRSNENSYNVNV